jgi:acyl dehydratase
MPMAEDPWADTILGKPGLGATAERRRKTSMHDVELFAEMTGDHNPLHFDEALTRKTRIGARSLPGGVVSGILNAIVAGDLPGPGTVFLGVDWQFRKAIRVGDTMTGRVEVLTVRDDKPVCTLKTEVANSDGEVCLSGTAATYTLPLKSG